MYLEMRIVELETKVAFQDDTIQTLNDVLAKQQDELANMRKQMNHLVELLRGMQSQMRESYHEAPPPHY